MILLSYEDTVHDRLLHIYTGGITVSVLALCAGLRRRGHEVKVLSLSNSNKSFRKGDDYFIRSLPAFYYPDMRISFAVRDPLIDELVGWRPDLVHVQTESTARLIGLRIAKRCRVPVVITCHTDYGHFVFGKFKLTAPVRLLLRTAGKILYRGADKVVAPSEKAAAFPFLEGVRERISVVPNGMLTEKYRKHYSPDERRAFRSSLGIPDGTGVLLVLSRLSKEKNVREVITYFAGLLGSDPDTRLLIVGDGPDRKKLERLAQKPGLTRRVIFTGKVPSEDVWRFYDASDLFVSASTFEVHSMSYFEALANGLPMLCRADEALTGVLEHGKNGMIYQNEPQFTEYAHRVLRDVELRESMRRHSLRIADGFSADAFAAAMLSVYDETTDKYKSKEDRKRRRSFRA